MVRPFFIKLKDTFINLNNVQEIETMSNDFDDGYSLVFAYVNGTSAFHYETKKDLEKDFNSALRDAILYVRSGRESHE